MKIAVEFFRRIADVAGAETLPRFRRFGDVLNKLEGGFDPVTEGDREAEKAIRALIKAEHPGHGILGEEFGSENPSSEYVWVIDPIDGTRSYISGIPLWGTLVGLTHKGNAVAGMMAQPFIGELFYATGGEAWYEGPHASQAGKSAPRQRLSTRKTARLADATLCTTTPALFQGDRRVAYDRLERSVRLARYGTDCYAYAMLAAGNIDLVVEVGLQTYDIVALIPIIEAAGGMVTEWSGGPAEDGGGIVAAATPALHAAAMEVLHAGRSDAVG
ncbi:MAG: histidinol-phosphatase [Hyphomicrobiales bacterium]|nr:histidinol-phosphatase [Hyphomicrobiales bacterium]